MTRVEDGGVVLPAVDDDELQRLVQTRRSVRDFSDRAIPLRALASLLRAVAGHRSVPSARASYPIAATVVAGRVDGLDAAAYRYDAARHVLEVTRAGDHRSTVASATLDAEWADTCPALLLLSADLDAARARFPDQPPAHGERFVWLEAGCMAQNTYLGAARHGFGTVLIAGLDDDRSADAATALLPPGHDLLTILPIGFPHVGD